MYVFRMCLLCLITLLISSPLYAQSNFLLKPFSQSKGFVFKHLFFDNQIYTSKDSTKDSIPMHSNDVLKAEFYLSERMQFSNLYLEQTHQKILLNFIDYDSSLFQASIHNRNGKLIKPIQSSQVLLEELEEGSFVIVLENKGSFSKITTKFIE